jgi:hypothetical protein
MRWAKPLHPPALLVDEYRRVAPVCFAQFGDKRFYLRRCIDVSAKKNEAPRLSVTHKVALRRA